MNAQIKSWDDVDGEETEPTLCYVECDLCGRTRVCNWPVDHIKKIDKFGYATYTDECEEMHYFMSEWGWHLKFDHPFNLLFKVGVSGSGARSNGKVYQSIPERICVQCQKMIYPIVHRLADIDQCFYLVNKLERTIREKRNQDNRRSPNNAGELCKGSCSRLDGY